MRLGLLGVSALLAVLGALVACTSPSASEPPTVNVAGTWDGTMSADDDPDAVGEPVRFLLSQAGASVSGTFHALGEDGVASGALGVFSGQVSGDALSLTLVLDPEATDPGRGTFTGMVIGDSFTLRGGLVDDATGDSFSLTFEMTRGAANPLESAVD